MNPSLTDMILSEPRRKYNSIHPSSLHKCIRAHYYCLTEEPKPYKKGDVGMILMGMVGEAFHEVIGELFKKHYNCVTEKVLDVSDGANGRPDIIIVPDGDKDSYPIEVKTVTTDGWSKILRRPRHRDVLQAQYYMDRLGADKMVLYYVSRDRGRPKRHDLTRNDTIVKANKNYIKTLNTHWKDKTKPPRPYQDKYEKECMRCDWKKECWAPEEAGA